jgi:hypothetical protein
MVFAMAGQGRQQAAGELLDQAFSGSPEQLLMLVEGLEQMVDSASAAARPELANLTLMIARRLRASSDLNAAQRRQVEFAFARALVAAGLRQEALDELAGLAKQFPRDGAVQEQHARLLSDGPDASSWQAALDKWRDIGRKCRPGSERWLRSMYHQALACQRLGQNKKAAQLIQLTQRQYPDLGGAAMKQQFLTLLSKVGGAG